ncbi:MAG: phage tail protein [Bacteroidales bacterium]|jgi:phage tail-like protein|nr:phage tail protein [Bacteroidales bacterium]
MSKSATLPVNQIVSNDQYENLPVAFYFSVTFIEFNEKISFSEVSGLSVEMETESVNEGGVNNFEHKLPKQNKHANLVLKSAIMPLDGKVQQWIKTSLESDFSEPFSKKCLQISLLNNMGTPVRCWSCENAIPVKSEVSTFDSVKNEIVIESLEFSYQNLKRTM